MRPRAALAAALTLAAVLCAAPPAGRGRGVRVVKRPVPDATYLFWGEVHSGGVHITALPPVLARGDEFDLIDSRGFAGRATVQTVEDVPLCQTSYKRGAAEWSRGAGRPLEGDSVAVGPARGPVPDRARVLAPGEVKSGAPPEMPYSIYRILLDLDGDQVPDLLRVHYECRNNPGAAANRGAGDVCIDTWKRTRREGWYLRDQTVLTGCY